MDGQAVIGANELMSGEKRAYTVAAASNMVCFVLRK